MSKHTGTNFTILESSSDRDQVQLEPIIHFSKRGEAFGWNTLVIDGHNIEAIAKAFHEAETTSGQPTLIVAQTYKGKDMPEQEDRDNWHGKPMPKEACEKIVKHLNVC